MFIVPVQTSLSFNVLWPIIVGVLLLSNVTWAVYYFKEIVGNESMIGHLITPCGIYYNIHGADCCL